jgi:glycine/D-amino acid oxidase-like deaminating enzyme
MRDEPGLIARLRSHRALVRRVMHAPHVELRPDGQDQLVVHSREIDALIDPAADTEDLAARLHRLAIEAVPDLSTSELIEAAVAWRPLPGDGFPSVGAVDGLGGYYEAVTHSGMTLGVIVGRLLAQEIMDGTVDDLLAPYRPGRFVAAPAAPPPLRASQEADLVDVPLTP